MQCGIKFTGQWTACEANKRKGVVFFFLTQKLPCHVLVVFLIQDGSGRSVLLAARSRTTRKWWVITGHEGFGSGQNEDSSIFQTIGEAHARVLAFQPAPLRYSNPKYWLA